jgi:pimeloyl-ACP methyl ester carboxylesterase
MVRRFYVDLPTGQVHGRIGYVPGKPWLVLLHQSPSSSAMFDAIMPELMRHFSVIAPDNPGFGQSDPLEVLSVSTLADCVAQVLATHGITRAFVFGHHTGAAIAAHLSVTLPDLCLGVALCGPPALSPIERTKLAAMAPVETPEPSGAHLMAMWAKLRSKETNAPPTLSTRELGLAFSAVSTKQAYEAVAAYDFMAALGQISCPLLMFAGERDSLVDYLPAAQIAAPHAKVMRIEDSGGYICDLRPAFVAELLSNFFLGSNEQGLDAS